MVESANSEPDNRGSGDLEKAREFGAREVGGEAESRQADNRGLSANNVSGEDGGGALSPGRTEGQSEFGTAPSEDGASQSEDYAAEDDSQRPNKATSNTHQIFGKEFRDSQVGGLDTFLSSLGEGIGRLRETKDQMVETLLAIPGSLPRANLDEAVKAAAKTVEKRQKDFVLHLEELRGDIAEEVDFAKQRHEPTDDRDRRSSKGDGDTSSFE